MSWIYFIQARYGVTPWHQAIHNAYDEIPDCLKQFNVAAQGVVQV
jgi:hypothetical protein